MKFNYQEQANQPGIYKIVNIQNNRVYIGQCSSFKKRWYQHSCSLQVGKHQNKFIQADFNKTKELLGHDDFLEFHVLEVMVGSTKEERNAQECKYIEEVYHLVLPDGSRGCYNFKEKPSAKERTHYSNTPEETKAKKSSSMQKKWSEESYREKISVSQEEFWNTDEGKVMASERASALWTNPEHQEAMSWTMKERMSNPEEKAEMMRRLSSREVIEKRSKTFKARFASDPEFRAMVQRHARENIAQRNRSQPVKTYGSVKAPDGTIYESISHVPTFAKEHGLQKQNLYSLLHGKVKSHKGWTLFIPKQEPGNEIA